MKFNKRWRLGSGLALVSIIIILNLACGGPDPEPLTYSISGQVTSNGEGLSGVTVTLSGDYTGTITTDNNGDYSFTGLSNGSYTVTPTKTDYSFDSQYRNVNIAGSNQINVNFTAAPVRLEPEDTKSVYGTVSLPAQSPVDQSSLKVQSILSNVNVGSTGNFYNLPMIDEGGGQIVFVLDSSDNPIMVAYISGQSVTNGTVSIGAKEMALGLIAFNPYLMILSKDQRADILEQVEWHTDFNGLVSNIEAALIQSPENALDYETYPYVYQTAMAIGLEILESYGDNLTASHGSYGILSSVGQDDDPHIDDPTGSDVTFVNPKMVFYGIQIDPPAGGVDDLLLRGKGSLLSLQLGWPPIVPTSPHEHSFNLGDGTFVITFYKGFNTSVNGWLNPWTAPGKATYANFLKCVSIVLDFLGAQWYINLNDTTIFYLLSAVDPPSLYFDTSFMDALNTVGWLDLINDHLIPYLIVHWDEIAHWVYQQSPGDNTAQALQSALKVVEGVAHAIPIAKILVLGTKAVNEYIPFGWDLVTAPSIIEYNVKQTDGVLNEISSLVPPTAVFKFEPLQPSVGESVYFDASDSYDDSDPTSSLKVKWDFDGDGSWDTSWSTNKTATFSFADRGAYRSALQVKDTDGLIGNTSHDIYVGAAEELEPLPIVWTKNSLV